VLPSLFQGTYRLTGRQTEMTENTTTPLGRWCQNLEEPRAMDYGMLYYFHADDCKMVLASMTWIDSGINLCFNSAQALRGTVELTSSGSNLTSRRLRTPLSPPTAYTAVGRLSSNVLIICSLDQTLHSKLRRCGIDSTSVYYMLMIGLSEYH